MEAKNGEIRFEIQIVNRMAWYLCTCNCWGHVHLNERTPFDFLYQFNKKIQSLLKFNKAQMKGNWCSTGQTTIRIMSMLYCSLDFVSLIVAIFKNEQTLIEQFCDWKLKNDRTTVKDLSEMCCWTFSICYMVTDHCSAQYESNKTEKNDLFKNYFIDPDRCAQRISPLP